MRTLITIAALAAATQAIKISANISSKEQEGFLEFMAANGKHYDDEGEFKLRQAAFAKIDRWISKKNSDPNDTATYAHNQFSDMTLKEKLKMLGVGKKAQKMIQKLKDQGDEGSDDEDTAAAEVNATWSPIDWREEGVVQEIKNQGSCGSCWAFSSISHLESLWAIKTGDLHNLSEQQLVDCATTGNYGCNGGFMSNVYNFYTYNHDVIADEDYPYTASVGECQDSSIEATGVHNVRNGYVKSTWDANTIKMALQRYPMAIAVAAGNNYWYQYSSGILNTDGCAQSIDHAVNMVGWGTEEGQDYWIVRNSWGGSWGEDGYIRIAATEDGNGICMAQSTLVTVSV